MCLGLAENFNNSIVLASGSVKSNLRYHRTFLMEFSSSSRRQLSVHQADSTTGGTDDGPHQLSTIPDIPVIQNKELLELCSRCERIDFNAIFEPARSELYKPYGWYLGELNKEASCALCRFSYSMRWSQRSPTNTHHYPWMSKSTLHWYLLGRENAGSAAYPVSHYAPSMVLCILPGKPGHTFHVSRHETHWIVPQTSLTGSLFGTAKPKLTALPFSPTSINYALLRSWCEHCDIHHSTCASAKKTKPGSDQQGVGAILRCIDCHTREIVEIATSDRFFALSYVWGEQPAPGSECTIGAGEAASRSSVRQLPSGVPKVIQDAMTVVASLGERYLWVDQYCIDQNDADDKHAQIGNMASIYEGAYATIVAFSATNSASGLPGVNNLPRKPYPSMSVPHSKLSLSAIRPSAISSAQLVTSSVWMTRGWTYQEAILSRRLLIFTDYQVEFVCSYAVWHECTLPGMRDESSRPPARTGLPSLDVNLLKAITPMERPSSDDKIPVDMRVLTKYIEEYSGRHLSYQSDALNAITGLLSRISTFTYLGIPVYDPFAWPRKFVVERALVRFLVYLTWYPAKGSLQRRCAFPSWSWLGWEGRVKFPSLKFDQSRAYTSVWTTNQATHSNGKTLVPFAYLLQEPPLDKEPTSVLPHLNEYLWVEGPVIKMTFSLAQATGRGEFFPRSSNPPMHIVDASGNKICFRNCKPYSKSQDALCERVITEDWDCFLLVVDESLVGEFRHGYFLILDQDRRDNDTEAEDHHIVVGSAKLIIDTSGNHFPWHDPSLRRKIKLG